jgi:hypothetical protein
MMRQCAATASLLPAAAVIPADVTTSVALGVCAHSTAAGGTMLRAPAVYLLDICRGFNACSATTHCCLNPNPNDMATSKP